MVVVVGVDAVIEIRRPREQRTAQDCRGNQPMAFVSRSGTVQDLHPNPERRIPDPPHRHTLTEQSVPESLGDDVAVRVDTVLCEL